MISLISRAGIKTRGKRKASHAHSTHKQTNLPTQSGSRNLPLTRIGRIELGHILGLLVRYAANHKHKHVLRSICGADGRGYVTTKSVRQMNNEANVMCASVRGLSDGMCLHASIRVYLCSRWDGEEMDGFGASFLPSYRSLKGLSRKG